MSISARMPHDCSQEFGWRRNGIFCYIDCSRRRWVRSTPVPNDSGSAPDLCIEASSFGAMTEEVVESAEDMRQSRSGGGLVEP